MARHLVLSSSIAKESTVGPFETKRNVYYSLMRNQTLNTKAINWVQLTLGPLNFSYIFENHEGKCYASKFFRKTKTIIDQLFHDDDKATPANRIAKEVAGVEQGYPEVSKQLLHMMGPVDFEDTTYGNGIPTKTLWCRKIITFDQSSQVVNRLKVRSVGELNTNLVVGSNMISLQSADRVYFFKMITTNEEDDDKVPTLVHTWAVYAKCGETFTSVCHTDQYAAIRRRTHRTPQDVPFLVWIHDMETGEKIYSIPCTERQMVLTNDLAAIQFRTMIFTVDLSKDDPALQTKCAREKLLRARINNSTNHEKIDFYESMLSDDRTTNLMDHCGAHPMEKEKKDKTNREIRADEWDVFRHRDKQLVRTGAPVIIMTPLMENVILTVHRMPENQQKWIYTAIATMKPLCKLRVIIDPELNPPPHRCSTDVNLFTKKDGVRTNMSQAEILIKVLSTIGVVD
jgi:hypothetical protein